MLLRASGELQGMPVDLAAVTQGEAAGAAGVAHGALLLRYADAALGDDAAALDAARRALCEAVGAEAFVDAAAVVANFQRMVRIADATGIPLDPPLELMTQDLRRDLALERFGSARNTPQAGPGRRVAGGIARALARVGLRVLRVRPRRV